MVAGLTVKYMNMLQSMNELKDQVYCYVNDWYWYCMKHMRQSTIEGTTMADDDNLSSLDILIISSRTEICSRVHEAPSQQQPLSTSWSRPYFSSNVCRSQAQNPVVRKILYTAKIAQTARNFIPVALPIVSANGSVTEKLSLFVNHHIKPHVSSLPSCVKDDMDFLHTIVNADGPLPPNQLICTMDVSALYTNIPTQEGISASRSFLQDKFSHWTVWCVLWSHEHCSDSQQLHLWWQALQASIWYQHEYQNGT